MTGRFWAAVDRHTGLDLHAASPERRARVRFIGGLAAFGVVAGLALAPLSVLTGGSPAIGLGAALACVAFLLWLRRPDRVDAVVHAMTLMIVALALGAAVALPAPGNPSLAWIMILGLTPLTFPRRAARLGYAVVPLVLAAVIAPPPPLAPGLSPLGGVLGVLIVGVVMVSFMVATHRLAVAELEAELITQRAVEADLVRSAAELSAGADESVSSLVTLNHAVRTPLNGLVGVADMLLHEDPEEALGEALGELRAASRGLLDVLETLLYLARTTARGGPSVEPTDLPTTLAALAARARVELVASRAPLPRVAALDAVALRVILNQLLAAMVRLDLADVTVAAEQRGASLVVQVGGARVGDASRRCSDGDRVAADELGLSVARALACNVGGELVHRIEARVFTVELSLPSAPVASIAAPPTRANPPGVCRTAA